MEKLTMDEFPQVGYDDWKKMALKELRDKSFDSLIWKNENGFSIEPYYTDATTLEQRIRAEGNVWEICQTVYESDATAANSVALQLLNGGATAIRFAASFSELKDIQLLLKDIGIEFIAVHFSVNSGEEARELLSSLSKYCEERGVDGKSLSGSFGWDVIQALSEGDGWKEHAHFAKNNFPGMRLFSVNAVQVHNRGGNASHDLAYALSVGNEFLHQISESNISAEDAVKMLQFNFATDSSYFVEIAKYRVFRNLWSAIVEQYSGKAAKHPVYIHAETSSYLQTTRDAYNNLLRATTQAMSAAIGMADSIEVICYDNAFAPASESSLRLARNIQHLLIEESYLNGHQDFAAGAHYQETLAQELSTAAWNLFLEIEKQGGIVKANPYLKKLIHESAETKKQDLKDGKRVLVGVNKYINKTEADVEGHPGRLSSAD